MGKKAIGHRWIPEPSYLKDGEELGIDHCQYRIIVADQGFNKQDVHVERYSGSKAGRTMVKATSTEDERYSRAEMTDPSGNIILTHTDTNYTSNASGMKAKLRWAYCILTGDDFNSYYPSERRYLSPTPNIIVSHALTRAGHGDDLEESNYGFDVIGKRKADWFGPSVDRLYPINPAYGREDLLNYEQRPDFVKIVTYDYKKFAPVEELIGGSRWFSKHKNIGNLAKKLKVFLVPGTVNTGMEVDVVNGDETHKLVRLRRDLFNHEQIIYGRPTDVVEAIDGKIRYEIGLDTSFWNASELNPRYWKQSLWDNMINSKPVTFQGKHHGIGFFTPTMGTIYVKELEDDGAYGEYGAQIDINAKRSHKDWVNTFSLLRPKEYLMDFSDMAHADQHPELWDYLANNGQWIDYLAAHGKTLPEWLDGAEFLPDGKKRVNIINDVVVAKRDGKIEKMKRGGVGSFRIKKDGLYFYGEGNILFKVGDVADSDGKQEVYTDGVVEIGDIIMQRGIGRSIYTEQNGTDSSGKSKYTKKTNPADTNVQYIINVALREGHEYDGPLYFKAIMAALLSRQKEFRIGTHPMVRDSLHHWQTRMEPAIDFLNVAVYGKDDAIYDGHDLGVYTWTAPALNANATPDLAFLLQKIFPHKITDEDIEPYMDWWEQSVGETGSIAV